MAVNQNLGPTFNVVERYPLSDDRQGLIKRFKPAGYIQLEPHPKESGNGYNILWASDMGVLEVLERLSPDYDLKGFNGFFGHSKKPIVEDTAQKSVDLARKHPDDATAFSIDGPHVGLNWYRARKLWTYTDVSHNEVALVVHDAGRQAVAQMIEATGIEAVREAAAQTLEEFATDIPLLRRA
jgi:hypothetical protein